MTGTAPTASSSRDWLYPDLLLSLAVTIGLLLVTFVPVVRATPLRIPFGFVFVMLVPGYAAMAAIYPERHTPEQSSMRSDKDTGITLLERLLLSVACSIVIVPVIGYAFNYTPGGIRLVPVLATNATVTVALIAVAAWRRNEVPEPDRFGIAVGPALEALPERVSMVRRDKISLFVVVSMVLFTVTAGYAVAAGTPDSDYSELYVLGEDGEQLADANLSAELEGGEPQQIPIGVTNHEGQTVNYTVVVVQQAVESQGNRTVVEDQRRLDRFDLRVRDNETRVESRTYTPAEMDDARLVWLLYTDEVPADPTTANADYSTHVWFDETAQRGQRSPGESFQSDYSKQRLTRPTTDSIDSS